MPLHLITHYLKHVREWSHLLADVGFVVFLLGHILEWILTKFQGAH